MALKFLKEIISIFKQECLFIIKNKDLREMVLLAPIVYALILSFVYYKGRVTEVPIGVVVTKSSSIGQKLLRHIDSSQQVKIIDQYTNHIEATEALKKGDINAWIAIPSQFSLNIDKGRIASAWLASNSSNFMLSNPIVMTAAETSLDLSAENLINYEMKKGVVRHKTEVIAKPILLNTELIFNPQMNYSSFFVPGLLFAILQQIIIIGFCLSIVTKKEQNILPEKLNLKWFLGAGFPYVAINTFFAFFFVIIIYPLLGISVIRNKYLVDPISIGFYFNFIIYYCEYSYR